MLLMKNALGEGVSVWKSPGKAPGHFDAERLEVE